jgi:phosphopantetheine adenylyltransferase
VIDRHSTHDRTEPCLQVAYRHRRVRTFFNAEKRSLYDVFGIRDVAGYAQRDRDQNASL